MNLNMKHITTCLDFPVWLDSSSWLLIPYFMETTCQTLKIHISTLMLYMFTSKIYYQHTGFQNCFLFWSYAEFTLNLINFDVSGSPPVFLSAPSVIVGDDGFSYIVGCKYKFVEELQPDLTEYGYLLVNETVQTKLKGSSRRLNENTFQLPQHIFITPGKYQCLIEARSLYNKSIRSELSAFIPMPGRIIFSYCGFVNQKINWILRNKKKTI